MTGHYSHAILWLPGDDRQAFGYLVPQTGKVDLSLNGADALPGASLCADGQIHVSLAPQERRNLAIRRSFPPRYRTADFGAGMVAAWCRLSVGRLSMEALGYDPPQHYRNRSRRKRRKHDHNKPETTHQQKRVSSSYLQSSID